MRNTGAAWMCCVLALTTGCAESSEEQLETAEQAIQGEAEGEIDVPLPGSEPLPPEAEGAPIHGEPVPPDVIAKQNAYLTAVNAQLAGWQAAGKSEQAIEALQAALKREFFEE